MKSVTIGLLIALSAAGNLRADTPVAPFAFVAPSLSGMYFFEMIPPQWNSSKDGLLDNGRGVAYQLLRDGSQKELWRTDGWYFQRRNASRALCRSNSGPETAFASDTLPALSMTASTTTVPDTFIWIAMAG